ncbi:hypothetical protein ACF3NT_07055 [Naumannella halotolerans]|uniref:hypothetical protein n=1 Tax=Naumannella halotolerans TaxID=993414 RepID=UPI00370D7778
MPTFPSADDPGLYNRPLPTPAEVGRYLGISPDAEQVESLKLHIDNSVQAVFAYTRGTGFYSPMNSLQVQPPLYRVIIGLAARAFNNPTSDESFSAGTLSKRPGLPEFTLADRLIMNTYRRQSA